MLTEIMLNYDSYSVSRQENRFHDFLHAIIGANRGGDLEGLGFINP